MAVRRKTKRHRRLLLGLLLLVLAVTLLATFTYVVRLDHSVRQQFEGKRWALPARVYARPLELYPGQTLSHKQLLAELSALRYSKVGTLKYTGSYQTSAASIRLITRPFTFWDGKEPSAQIRVDFSGNTVAGVTYKDGETAGLLRLDPMLIGGIYPAHNEDRILVKLGDVPPLLIRSLIAVEDRDFYTHHGVSLRATLRALFANMRAFSTVQGGSTLTQQLVKNFYLSNERTLKRKINEAVMAVLLDWHYGKEEILEAYLNEVYLGQEGERAIHGFGLASQFYFHRPLVDLEAQEIALLVAMVKGPSFYEPRRNPDRARSRRNLVLDVLGEQGVLTAAQTEAAKQQPLGVAETAPGGITAYPAFLDLVRRQLQREYREEDLTSEGLQIFTTLDPLLQGEAERALAKKLRDLEKSRKRLAAGSLQGAVIVTSVEGGEVLAIVGGREARYSGFNRALDARRQIGSLVKPAIYLTALARPHEYTLASVLNDAPLRYKNADGTYWTPENYDQEYHGRIALVSALARSYNAATAHLGLDVGVPRVIETLQKLGVERAIKPYASVLLGALELTPLEVTQMYHTLAAGGFRTPLRVIREVLTVSGEPVQRYPLTVKQVFDPAPIYLVNTALQEVVRRGTARSLLRTLDAELNIAGKTGTTDDLRDSWFAGFSGDKLAVVWVGRDDNQPAGFSGATGALPVWSEFMRHSHARALQLIRPTNIEYAWIDPYTGWRTDAVCTGRVQLPFIRGSAPQDYFSCLEDTPPQNPMERSVEWFKSLLN